MKATKLMKATANSAALTDLLYAAANSPYGVEVRCWPDASTLRAKLYPLRQMDPLFGQLSFQLSPSEPTNYLWITKSRASDVQDD